MKIGFDAKRLFHNSTGLGNYSRSLVDCLSNQFPENDYRLYTPKLGSMGNSHQLSQQANISTFVPKALFKSKWRSFGVTQQLEKDGVEVYHGLSNELPFNIHESSIKSVVTIHDLIFKVYPETYPLIDRKIYDKKFKYACENADIVVAVSEHTKRDIVKYYGIDPKKIEVVYTSINPKLFEPNSIEKNESVLEKHGIPKDFLLHVGSITERKNIKFLVDGYSKLADEFQIPLVIIGRGNLRSSLIDYATSIGLKDKILWLDQVNENSDLSSILEMAKAMIYPSVYEGFGLPLTEALLRKTPVISTNSSSLPEAGGPNSIYVDPQNSDELTNAIKQVISDEELRNKMISKGYQYATEKFDAHKITSQMMGIYERVRM